MCRLTLVVLLLPFLAQGEEEATGKRHLRAKMVAGARYAGSNTVSFKIKTTVRRGDRETSSFESVQRTERFADEVLRAGQNSVLEIRREYLTSYSKVRTTDKGRPVVHRSPIQGRKILIRERRRRREVEIEGHPMSEPLLRRIVGMEIDWRDIFPDHQVAPGDSWEADATAIARRLAAYLDCGSRSKMRVNYEENVQGPRGEQAKLYVDWVLEGMRDKTLFTKVSLAGDVVFDFTMQRVVDVDLAGSIIVRGAVVTETTPRIVKGEGQVIVQSKVEPQKVEAAADDESDGEEK